MKANAVVTQDGEHSGEKGLFAPVAVWPLLIHKF